MFLYYHSLAFIYLELHARFSETVETIVAKNILNSAFVFETSTESEPISTFDALWSN